MSLNNSKSGGLAPLATPWMWQYLGWTHGLLLLKSDPYQYEEHFKHVANQTAWRSAAEPSYLMTRVPFWTLDFNTS
jgi:hypothetical protein